MLKYGYHKIIYSILEETQMAEMVKYNDNYISRAYALIERRSTDDDIKAMEDLHIVDIILSGADTYVDLDILDDRLRKEYKTIKVVESVANKYIFDDGQPEKRIVSEKIKMMNKLKKDRIGIIADVLIKHRLIKCVDELYVKNVK